MAMHPFNQHEASSTASGDADSTTGGSKSGRSECTTNNGQDESSLLLRTEEKAIRKAKCVMGLSVLICAVAVLLSVYFLNAQSDQRSFELAYQEMVTDIQSLVVWEVRYNFALMEQLSSQITIAAGLKNETFPFHTQPEFEITGGFVDGMGGIMAAGFAPIITSQQRDDWETYAVKNQGWIEKSAHLKAVSPTHRDALHGTIQDHEHDRRNLQQQEPISASIYRWENGQRIPEISEPGQELAPMWQISPADANAINVNLLSDNMIAEIYTKMMKTKSVILSSNVEIGDMFDFLFDESEKKFKTDPHAFIIGPIFSKIEEEEKQKIVGIIVGVTPFGNLFDRLLPQYADGGIVAVVEDDCGNVLSFELSSGKAVFLGYGDFHDPDFDEYAQVTNNIELYDEDDIEFLCGHQLYLYPTATLKESYTTNSVGIYVAIIGIAVTLILSFAIYDYLVSKRQRKTMQSAIKTRAIVSSLFPEKIARKLVNEACEPHDEGKKAKTFLNARAKLETIMHKETDLEDKEPMHKDTKPLAELFPEATVMFGDLVGFTAWSSQREPHQVFKLLETLYAEFDALANQRGVFKVETVGDCYVAVCGLPTPNKRHCVIMARFAHDCYAKTAIVLRQLEVELGPDTASLGIRIGLNSGPVTAGVLRGERARFQLFGDTVNTTARIEATGAKNRIHVSDETARRLVAHGKEHWLQLRDDKINAKGKGELTTYWLNLGSATTASISKSERSDASPEEPGKFELSPKSKLRTRSMNITESQNRVVEWNVDLLQRQLRILVAHRQAKGTKASREAEIRSLEVELSHPRTTPLDEVADVLTLATYDDKVVSADPASVHISDKAMSQLRHFVKTIAGMYHRNPFHNYEHASHVTMSCLKLLSRVVSPEIHDNSGNSTKNLHDLTYGITSDPLTQFSVLFAGMIHDVDHPGVPNTQLHTESHELSILYKNRSSAEQNSVDVAWSLLMEDAYIDLRRTIYTTQDELLRFRQLVVNAVMATDIMDKELGLARKARWNKAFAARIIDHNDTTEDINRKATIVIEHLIQAADVAHTMQHWHVFHRWNERLFCEAYLAYKAGRAPKDPTDGWYEGEIGFFDFYVIPLAKKLKDCGVFGVSSDECLSYAERNREEWVARGHDVVQEYLEKLHGQAV